MVVEVKHDIRQGAIGVAGRRPQTATVRGASSGIAINQIGVLATMYQRIPGNVLYKMEAKDVQNYALLEGDGIPKRRNFAVPCTQTQHISSENSSAKEYFGFTMVSPFELIKPYNLFFSNG